MKTMDTTDLHAQHVSLFLSNCTTWISIPFTSIHRSQTKIKIKDRKKERFGVALSKSL